MPNDLPMSMLFLIFLILFVLLGSTPVLSRITTLFNALLRNPQGWKWGGVEELLKEQEQPVYSADSSRLNDYEIIVLRKLAMGGHKNFTRKALANALYFQPATITRTLTSLRRRGLVVRTKALLGERFSLTVAGREYCVAQDMVPAYHEQSRGTRTLSKVDL